MCMCASARLIQVTGASVENDIPQSGGWGRAPTGVAVTKEQVYKWLCVSMHGALAATLYHTSAFYEFIRMHCCVCFALCVCDCGRVGAWVCVLTVILYDRMITPFSLELRGISQLRSLSSINPRGGTCAHMYVNARFLWATALLCISVSPPIFSTACRDHLRSLYDI